MIQSCIHYQNIRIFDVLNVRVQGQVRLLHVIICPILTWVGLINLQHDKKEIIFIPFDTFFVTYDFQSFPKDKLYYFFLRNGCWGSDKTSLLRCLLGFLLPSPLPILTEKCEEYGPPRTVERLMTQVSPSAITFCAPGKCWRKIWTLKGALSNDPILEYSNLQDIQDYYGLFPRLIVSPLGKEWVAWRNRQKNKALTPWSPIFSLDPIRCISRLHFCSSINTPPIDTVLASVYKMRWSVSFIITKCDALTHRFLTLKKNQEKHLFLPQ